MLAGIWMMARFSLHHLHRIPPLSIQAKASGDSTGVSQYFTARLVDMDILLAVRLAKSGAKRRDLCEQMR